MSKPLFMWAGGKTKMLKKYAPYLPQRVDHYCEPFFGGGAMFIHVMNHYKPRGTVVINDINPALVNIYRSIRDARAEFQAHLDILENVYLPKSKEERKAYYYEVRRQHAFEYEQWSTAAEAATLYSTFS